MNNDVAEQLLYILDHYKDFDDLTKWEKSLINNRLKAHKVYGSSFHITEAQKGKFKEIYIKIKLRNSDGIYD